MLRSFRKEQRSYPFMNHRTNRMDYHTVLYTIHFENSKLVDVRNESYSSVEIGSECWDYFHTKFK